jgi:hypothetical protein
VGGNELAFDVRVEADENTGEGVGNNTIEDDQQTSRSGRAGRATSRRSAGSGERAQPAEQAPRLDLAGPGDPAPPANGDAAQAQPAGQTEAAGALPSASAEPGQQVGQAEQGEADDLGIPLEAEAPQGLALLGLTKGDPVRWRRKAGQRWQQGAIIGIENDGSLAVSDSQGRWRSLVIDQLEVKGEGPRGATRWEPLSDRVGQPDQLGMFR